MSMTLAFYSLSLPSHLLCRLTEAEASLNIFIESKYVMILGSNSSRKGFKNWDLEYRFVFSFDSSF